VPSKYAGHRSRVRGGGLKRSPGPLVPIGESSVILKGIQSAAHSGLSPTTFPFGLVPTVL
jgi:hypothetical protein